MRGSCASASFVFVLSAVGAPSCGPSLDDTCDASGFSGRQVLTDTPSTMSGAFGFVETGFTPYTLTVRYDGGGVSCNARKTTQGPSSTTVDVLVSIHTADGRLAFDDVDGTLEEDVGGQLTLRATWDISKPIEDFCAKGSNVALALSGNPQPGASAFFLGDLDQTCGGASASLGALTQ